MTTTLDAGHLDIADTRSPKSPESYGRLELAQQSGRVYLVMPVPQRQQDPGAAQQASSEQRVKHLEHKNYLQRVSTEGSPPLISPETARKSWGLWLSVRRAVGSGIPVPSAGTGPDGQMFYSWDKGEHHLEAEIFPDRDAEFFYRNRLTGDLWGEDYAGGPLPEELLTKLRLFV